MRGTLLAFSTWLVQLFTWVKHHWIQWCFLFLYVSITDTSSHLKKYHTIMNTIILIIWLAKGGYVLVVSVCLSVCLSVSGQYYSKRCEWIAMKFYRGVWGGTMKNWLYFGGDMGLLRWVNEQQNTGPLVRGGKRNVIKFWWRSRSP